MTPFKNYSTQSTWKRSLRRGGMYVAVAALLSAQAACSSNDNGADWEEVTVQEPTKGVITTLEEKENGEFDIVDEQVVGTREASRVVIRRRDGSVDSLTLAQAKSLVQPQDTVAPRQPNQNNQGYHSHGMGMGGVLWWGAMGYMMGRNFGSPGYSSAYRGGYMPGNNVGDELRRTSVNRTVRMPAKGKSGFFRGFRNSSGA